MNHLTNPVTVPHRVLVLLLIMGVVLIPGLLLGVQDGEDEVENPSAKAVWKVDRVRGAESVQYEVTIYQIPAPGGNRWVWRAIASDGSYPGGFPIGSMLIQGSGNPRPELFDPLSPGVMEMLLSVHSAGTQGEGLGWADGTSVGLRRQIPVERTETVDAEGRVTQVGVLAGGTTQIRGGSRALKLSEFKETLLLGIGGSLKEAECCWRPDVGRNI